MTDSRSRRRTGRKTRSRGPDRNAPVEWNFAPVPVLILVSVGALLLAWLVVRISAANALLDARSGAASTFARWHPDVVLRPLGDALQAGGELSDEVTASGLEVLDRAPLSAEPLLLAAREAIERGDTARADRLVLAARRQNPRSRYALILLMEQQLRDRRMDDAALTMAVLSRVMPNSSDLLIAQMARMAQYPEMREATRGVIAEHPEMRGRLLEQLAQQGADADFILALAGPVARNGAAGEPRWQRLLLDSLVSRNEVSRAREIWGQLTGTRLPAAGAYDPGFTGMPGPPPFNWSFETSADGVAEISDGAPGLYVEYYARRDVRFGGQLIALPPGRYQLRFEVDGDASGEAGQLSWTISCYPGNRQIGRIPITGVTSGVKAINGMFVVPAGCGSQWLRLNGKSAEFPKSQQATIRDLRITGAGR